LLAAAAARLKSGSPVRIPAANTVTQEAAMALIGVHMRLAVAVAVAARRLMP
jgi:hypothetical protein